MFHLCLLECNSISVDFNFNVAWIAAIQQGRSNGRLIGRLDFHARHLIANWTVSPGLETLESMIPIICTSQSCIHFLFSAFFFSAEPSKNSFFPTRPQNYHIFAPFFDTFFPISKKSWECCFIQCCFGSCSSSIFLRKKGGETPREVKNPPKKLHG